MSVCPCVCRLYVYLKGEKGGWSGACQCFKVWTSLQMVLATDLAQIGFATSEADRQAVEEEAEGGGKG